MNYYKMTNQQKNQVIAELCGWTRPKCDRIGGCLKETGARSGFVWLCKCDIDERPLPHYTSDLNACAEMEKVLTDGQYDTFEQELAQVVKYTHHDNWPEPSGLRPVISATAAQRAEAFLRVHGQWI